MRTPTSFFRRLVLRGRFPLSQGRGDPYDVWPRSLERGPFLALAVSLLAGLRWGVAIRGRP